MLQAMSGTQLSECCSLLSCAAVGEDALPGHGHCHGHRQPKPEKTSIAIFSQFGESWKDLYSRH